MNISVLSNSESIEIVNNIVDDIISTIVEKQHEEEKQKFVEYIFISIIKIIENNNYPKTNETLHNYEFYRYNTIFSLLREFINKCINTNILDSSIRERLYKYLEYSYNKSKYYTIFANIYDSFKQKNMNVSNYITPHILQYKLKIREILLKQHRFLGIIQNKEILKTINKDSLDDLFNKIIFELTIYIMF